MRKRDEWWEGKSNRYPHVCEGPDLLGEVIRVAFLLGPYLEIPPWHLRGRFQGSCFGIIPHDTSPLIHSIIAGDVGVRSIKDIPSRQVS